MMNETIPRFRNILQPVIVPVVDEFRILDRKLMGGCDCVVLAHPLMRETNEACQWLTDNVGGHWLVPTVRIAGHEWVINPKYSDDGWNWLLLKA